MQRASSTNTRPSANRTQSSPQTATPLSEPASKRQKVDHTPDSSAPTTPATEPRLYASRSDIKAALQAESAFEAIARAKRAELGFGYNEYETEWVLNVQVPGVDSVQSNAESDEEESEEEDELQGRQNYGGFKRRKKTATATATSTPGSKSNTPAQTYKFDDFDSDDQDNVGEESEDGEIGSDSDNERRISVGGSGKKRKANRMLEEGEEDEGEDEAAAMLALDRVDLSKTGYAKSKGTKSTAATWFDQRNEKKAKKQGKSHGGKSKKKMGRKR